MSSSKEVWLCKIFGHKFKKLKDLRQTSLRRGRIVYRCKRCSEPLIVRTEQNY